TEIHNPVNPDVRDGPAPAYQALWVSDEDWSNARELTDVGALSVEQETSVLPFGWTSDGEYLFVLYEDQENERAILAGAELFAIPASGGEARPLDLKVTLQERLATSHAGVAVSTGGGLAAWTDRRIAVIAPDVSSHAILTPEDMAAVSPVWSPDGTRIAFVATEDRGLEARDEALASQRIWVTDADGSNQRQLTSAA